MNTQAIWNLRDQIIDERIELLETADGNYFEDAELHTRACDLELQVNILAHFAEAIEAGVNIYGDYSDPRTPAQVDADMQDRDYADTITDAQM